MEIIAQKGSERYDRRDIVPFFSYKFIADFVRNKYKQIFIEFTGGEEIEPANGKAFYSGRERDGVPSLGWAHKSGSRVYQSLHEPYGDSFVWICKRDKGHSIVAGKDKL